LASTSALRALNASRSLCQQAFLRSFDEEVDWEDGNDRMWSIFIAWTEAEVDSVNALPDNECAQGLHHETRHRVGVSNPSIVMGTDNQWKGNQLQLPWPP
jgi:hypothetical protein